MPMVIGVRFKNAGKLYYFNPGSLWPTAGDSVIIETARGVEYAQCVMGVHEISEENISSPLKNVIRVASEEDAQKHRANLENEKNVHRVCQQKIAEHKLDMKLVKVEYTFDRNKLIAYFTSNGRVDFRGLVKDMAAAFKTRIELKQIGVRDEAKMLGGLGSCGRPLCCSTCIWSSRRNSAQGPLSLPMPTRRPPCSSSTRLLRSFSPSAGQRKALAMIGPWRYSSCWPPNWKSARLTL